ncbi:hypothetical protein [Gluconacetobacter asukensis]|uniref:Uncharacterized protein n=1 Tax=Gluconacetobacter asukensis TaxID=1017181 RepID=A0A7W4P1J3_9PROT|nr:hypothetical protein [Gluconacetobacter asukensis]MBB2173834.1 hypothetical protein [Gluconacetobacter asukensis]
MTICKGKIPKNVLNLFSSDIGATDFFGYVGNMVSIEQATAVIGILSPDFVEYNNHIFWKADSSDFSPQSALTGFRENKPGQLLPSTERRDVERYQNNFSVNQFFSKWEDSPGSPVLKVGLTEKDHKLCHIFARQIEQYWHIALRECFPDRNFEFEVADNILDEYGVCLTFFQL